MLTESDILFKMKQKSVLPSIVQATSDYEAWVRTFIDLNDKDLKFKHQEMQTSPFAFMRATFYRFMQRWPEIKHKHQPIPHVPAIGDIHIENFGTWLDKEGRLVWGVNDFDEACTLPYTIDLVRLAVSAQLAAEEKKLALSLKDICHAILKGYKQGMISKGQPFVLEEQHGWLRHLVSDKRDPVAFWTKLSQLPHIEDPKPHHVKALLKRSLPAGAQLIFAHRVAGLGDLGHARVLARTSWQGGFMAREVKALAPSAAAWSAGEHDPHSHALTVLSDAVRSPDPTFNVRDGFILRRLAPDAQRVELIDLPKKRDEQKLLQAMGFEIANIHLGRPEATEEILKDLVHHNTKWLAAATSTHTKGIQQDWHDWKHRSDSVDA